jgi:hypothetical protein
LARIGIELDSNGGIPLVDDLKRCVSASVQHSRVN